MEIKYPSKRSNNPTEKKLYIFFHKLRNLYKKGKLKQKEIELCESIPGWKWKTIYNWCSKEKFIKWCKDNGIKKQKDYRNWCRENEKPDNIPSQPHNHYKDFSWSILSGFRMGNWCTKEEFIKWSKDNGIRSYVSFSEWCRNNKRPFNIPFEPSQQYENWSWGILSGKYVNIDFVSMNEFIKWCKNNGIKKQKDFENFPNKPKRIGDPFYVYGKKWKWGILSGIYRNIKWASKDEFIQWCKDNGINTYNSFVNWKKENKKPINIPTHPKRVYKDWEWGELSGYFINKTPKINKEEFIQWCKDNKVKSGVYFFTIDKPDNIPFDPYKFYENFSWNDIKEKFINKEEFIQWCKDNKVKKFCDFINIPIEIKQKNNIPSTPNQIYRNFSWCKISGFNNGKKVKRRKERG